MKNETVHLGDPAEPDWTERRRRVGGAPQDVDLYLVTLAEVRDWASTSTGWLAEDELARARKLHDEIQHREFLVSRVVLRRLLALRLDCPPEVVDLPRNSTTGAPGPATIRAGAGHNSDGYVHYSLARTPGHIAIVMANRPVGVDLESRQSADQAESLVRVLHPADQARLLREPERRRARAVTEAWVRLEALLKVRGTGLSTDPSSIEVGTANRVRHSDDLIVTGVRTRRGSHLHAAVAWLEDPLGTLEPTADPAKDR